MLNHHNLIMFVMLVLCIINAIGFVKIYYHHRDKQRHILAEKTSGNISGFLGDQKLRVCFVNSEAPVLRRAHIAYHATRIESKGSPKFCIGVTELVTYPHPTAPEEATVHAVETREIKTVTHTENAYAQALVLFYAEESLRNALGGT